MEGDNTNKSASSTGTGRLRFNIELRPDETTIVSWKKLIKEAACNDNNKPDPPPLIDSVQQKAQEVQFALDEYFQDENPTTDYNDFTISNGIMEHLNEPKPSSDCQLKKWKTNIPKVLEERVDDHEPNKHPKLGHARMKAAKNIRLVGPPSSHSQSLAASSEHYQDRLLQHPKDSAIRFSKKNHDDASSKSEYSLHSVISNDDSAAFTNPEDAENWRLGTTQCRRVGNNFKERKYVRKNDSKQLERPTKVILTGTCEREFYNNARQKEKNGSSRQKNGGSTLPDLNIPASAIEPAVSQKSASNSKNVPTLRPKVRPPNVEVQEADTSSISVKRRLPYEVKQKLAKVARLAQSSQGKISKELVNHLMSILGHLVQLRTLKRNLREMVLLGLSAKREKTDRIQLIKKEVIEMIKLQAWKTNDGGAGDFQEAFDSEGRDFLKEKFCTNMLLEDKICDLYDLYVQGMDEDKGPQIRKLYAELAELWPEGAMDNRGIKKAICRAKERRRALYDDGKVNEKVRGKKFPLQRTKVAVRGEVGSRAQAKAKPERMTTEANAPFLDSPTKMTSSATAFDHHLTAPAKMSSLMLKNSKMDLPRQVKLERTAQKQQLMQEEQEPGE